MINVSKFYEPNASDQWFTTPYLREQGSIQDQLKKRGFTFIDRSTLDSAYQTLEAPVNFIDLSYAKSVPLPSTGLKNVFVAGYAQNIKHTKVDDRDLGDILTDCISTALSGEIFVMSLFPKSYFLATAPAVSFEDIYDIARTWSIDCFIGVFDASNKSVFVFAEEYGLAHFSVDSNREIADIDVLEKAFSESFAKDVDGYLWPTTGDEARLREYYKKVVEPFK